jgi:GNAT superfamily N-acetyltransferase
MMVTEVGWAQTRVLRQQGLGWTGDPVPGDDGIETVHLAVLDAQSRPMAIVSACPHPCPERPGAAATYLWAMAVAERWRGRGVGSRLVSELARRSIAAGRTVLWADARGDAVGFYLACGATVLGDPYRDSITGLQDRRIVIDLEPEPGRPATAAG